MLVYAGRALRLVDAADLFDLRCAVRERMLAFLAAPHSETRPLLRMDVTCNEAWHTDGQSHARRARAAVDASAATTTSPGAEDVTPADLPAPAPR